MTTKRIEYLTQELVAGRLQSPNIIAECLSEIKALKAKLDLSKQKLLTPEEVAKYKLIRNEKCYDR